MGLSDQIFGTQNKLEKVDTLNPQGNQFLSQLFSMLSSQGGQSNILENKAYQSGLESLLGMLGGSDEDYRKFSEPYLRDYQENILPMVRERYGSSGPSSALDQALARSSENLGTNLASLKASMRQQAIPQALSYAQAPAQQFGQLGQLGLGTSPFAYHNMQGSTGALGSLLQGLGQAGGTYLGSGGNPLAALKSLFSQPKGP